MSISQQRIGYARSSHAPAQTDRLRAMMVAFPCEPEAALGTSPDSAEWYSGSKEGACVEDAMPDAIQQPGGRRKRRRSAALSEPQERRAKHTKPCSPCDPDVDTEPSPSSAEASPNSVQVCPAWEGLGKGFLDLALGLVAPLDASCPRVPRTPSPSLSDSQRMNNAIELFNRELDERLGSIAL